MCGPARLSTEVRNGSQAPAWSITAHGRCSLNSGRSLFPVETVVECQNGHLIEWLKPTPSNQRRTGGLNLKAVIRRRKPAAVAHQVGPWNLTTVPQIAFIP